jgi:hypothetical protein
MKFNIDDMYVYYCRRRREGSPKFTLLSGKLWLVRSSANVDSMGYALRSIWGVYAAPYTFVCRVVRR